MEMIKAEQNTVKYLEKLSMDSGMFMALVKEMRITQRNRVYAWPILFLKKNLFLFAKITFFSRVFQHPGIFGGPRSDT